MKLSHRFVTPGAFGFGARAHRTAAGTAALPISVSEFRLNSEERAKIDPNFEEVTEDAEEATKESLRRKAGRSASSLLVSVRSATQRSAKFVRWLPATPCAKTSRNPPPCPVSPLCMRLGSHTLGHPLAGSGVVIRRWCCRATRR